MLKFIYKKEHQITKLDWLKSVLLKLGALEKFHI
jgi:hypothetical protein